METQNETKAKEIAKKNLKVYYVVGNSYNECYKSAMQIAQWKAIDGKIFDTEKACEEYEKNPVTMLKSKLDISEADLWDLCFGSEDDDVEIINGDKLDIFKYVSLKSSFDDKLKLEALNNILNEKYTEDFIVMYNYDGDLFKGLWKQQIINRMNNTIKSAKEQFENK